MQNTLSAHEIAIFQTFKSFDTLLCTVIAYTKLLVVNMIHMNYFILIARFRETPESFVIGVIGSFTWFFSNHYRRLFVQVVVFLHSPKSSAFLLVSPHMVSMESV